MVDVRVSWGFIPSEVNVYWKQHFLAQDPQDYMQYAPWRAFMGVSEAYKESHRRHVDLEY